jgi:radical SAM-linked protein
MKARIKFQKYGSMKFIGHLDVMRYFQKAFRRAGFDNEYSKGFSPHQIMSFAAPLGVGLTSDAEYLDVSLLSSDEPGLMKERLNAVLTEGFRVIDFHPLLDAEFNTKTVTAMAQVASADYLVSLKDGYSVNENISSMQEFEAAFRAFLDREEIIINKKTKKSEKEENIKPMISLIAFSEDDYRNKLNCLTDTDIPVIKTDSCADIYQNGIKLYMQLDTGSHANLKPELVMEAFYESLGHAFNKFAWQVHRLELYARDDGNRRLTPLHALPR